MSGITTTQLIRQRNRRATSYSGQADLINLIGQRLLERLELVTITPDIIVDLGCCDGVTSRALKTIYPGAQVIGVEPSVSLCKVAQKQSGWFKKPRYLSALPNALPIQDDCADLVVINLYPVWQHDIRQLFIEINRVLTPEGLVLFTSLGPDTLLNLRASWQQVDPDYEHLMPFADMHDIGDALTGAGYHNIVMENEPLSIDYPTIESLHEDLRYTGYANLANSRRPTLLSKGRYQNYLSKLVSNDSSGLKITYDVVFGHGWKGIKQPKHAINAIPEQFEQIPFKSLD